MSNAVKRRWTARRVAWFLNLIYSLATATRFCTDANRRVRSTQRLDRSGDTPSSMFAVGRKLSTGLLMSRITIALALLLAFAKRPRGGLELL